MAPAEKPGLLEVPNLVFIAFTFALAINDLGGFAGHGLVTALHMLSAALAGSTLTRMLTWEASVVVDVLETGVPRDPDDAKPPEGP
jgi:hypothetical protein